MRKPQALKLDNRDQVEVRVDGNWTSAYVLGSPRVVEKRVIVPVQSQEHGFIEVDHTDVR